MTEEVSQWTFGDPQTFAVEFKMLRREPAPFGDLTLWIHGRAIGRENNPVFVYSVLTDLEAVVQLPTGADLELSPIEFFDGYKISAAHDNKVIRFVWVYTDPIKHLAMNPINATVPLAEVTAVVGQLRQLYDTLQ